MVAVAALPTLNSLDGIVVRASASGAANSGFISSRVKAMTITLVWPATPKQAGCSSLIAFSLGYRRINRLCHQIQKNTNVGFLNCKTVNGL